jgi:hypothetical protein
MSSTPTPPSQLTGYGSLLPAEAVVLREWLRQHEKEYDRFDFNVRIGSGTDPGDKYPDYVRQGAIKNTQRRIDAIGWSGNQATLIEVKSRASFNAMGQLLGYRQLWIADNPTLPEPILLLVAQSTAPNVREVAMSHKMGMDLVDVDLSQFFPGGHNG